MGRLLLEDWMPPEAERIAGHIAGLEKAALDRWFAGDTPVYADLWSKDSFSYFDAVVKERIDSHAEIMEFLAAIDGKLFADGYEFRELGFSSRRTWIWLF